MPYLHLHLKAIIKSAPEDEVAWGTHEELLTLSLCNGSNGSILLWNLTKHREQTQQYKPFLFSVFIKAQWELTNNRTTNVYIELLKHVFEGFFSEKAVHASLCKDGRVWLLIIDPFLNANNLYMCDACELYAYGVIVSVLWPTSMSLSGLRSWSHRMILWSLPPPVSRVPFLSWHSVNTLPSWALIWRLIWNAPERERKTEITCKHHPSCWDSTSVLSFS